MTGIEIAKLVGAGVVEVVVAAIKVGLGVAFGIALGALVMQTLVEQGICS